MVLRSVGEVQSARMEGNEHYGKQFLSTRPEFDVYAVWSETGWLLGGVLAWGHLSDHAFG
jgi:hypothetical protein